MLCCLLTASENINEMWLFSHLSIPVSMTKNTDFFGSTSFLSDFSENYSAIGLNFIPTSNLNLEINIYPYKNSTNLYHYHKINAIYIPSSSEEKPLPINMNLGSHYLINKTKAIIRWYNFGINYNFYHNNYEYSIMWQKLLSYNESFHIYGISVMKKIIPKFSPSIALIFNPINNQFKFQISMILNP